ncbi:MAG: helix-turn-helix domain-containing protein [Solirubrobacterales bacterium]
MDEQTQEVMAFVADRATRVRRDRGVSIAQLAQRSKIEEPALEAILRGEGNLRIQTVFRLAAALEVTPATLLRGIEWVPDAGGGGHFEIED